MRDLGRLPTWAWVLLSILVIAFDQITKWAIQQTMVFGHSVQVLPFLDLVLVYNPGAAFSFLSAASGWQRELFIVIGVAASAIIVYLLRRHASDPMFCFALSLILGGAVGNVIDRFRLGAVVDFLDVHVAGHHWPAFNLADSAITCGALLLIWDSFRRPRVQRARS